MQRWSSNDFPEHAFSTARTSSTDGTSVSFSGTAGCGTPSNGDGLDFVFAEQPFEPLLGPGVVPDGGLHRHRVEQLLQPGPDVLAGHLGDAGYPLSTCSRLVPARSAPADQGPTCTRRSEDKCVRSSGRPFSLGSSSGCPVGNNSTVTRIGSSAELGRRQQFRCAASSSAFGQVAVVVVQLADRHVQPRRGADVHHGVGRQRGVLGDPQTARRGPPPRPSRSGSAGGALPGQRVSPLDEDHLVLVCRRRKAGVELGVHGG
jgi:hypothetical protein